MGVFKEEATIIEAVAHRQARIYSDAADYGYAYNTNNPDKAIKSLINALDEFKAMDKEFPEDKPFIRNRQVWGDNKIGGVSIDLIIFWEKDKGYYKGTKYSISFSKISPHPSLLVKGNGYISIDINPYSEK